VAIGATPFKVSFQETFTYAGRDGRVSQRVLSQYTNDGAVSESFTQSWTYDVLGNVISLGYPDCTLAPCTSSPRTVSNTYTKGFLTGVTGFASSLTYHPNLQVNQVTNANGVVTTYAMDPNHMARPASIATTAGWSTGAYAYDGAGNVTRIGNGRFLYDGVSRLLQGVTVTTPADSTTTRTQTVGYDLYGNIQSITTNGSTLNTPTNSANRLTSSGTAYDAAGNLITWNWGNTYQYDPFGLLWHYTSGAEDWLYMYTADDQRVWAYRTGGSGNYWAIRDLDGKVLREYSTHAGWTVDRDYVYRGDKLLAAVTPQGTRHFHLDHLGSVRQVTNASAAQVAFHAYYPFGREATTLGQDNKEQMQFTGHERDLQNTTAGTNSDADDLDYMHARYYNMHVGRFTSVDPARSWEPKAPQSWNRYGYALGSPVTLLDPLGETAQDFNILDANQSFFSRLAHFIRTGDLSTLLSTARAHPVMAIDPDVLLKPELSLDEAVELAELVQGIRNLARQGELEPTLHGETRRQQGETDANRPSADFGRANRDVAEGRALRDTTTGNIVFHRGDNARVISPEGRQVTNLKLSSRTLQERIQSGRYIPIIEPR
jgi:RHS repeat-associated protein